MRLFLLAALLLPGITWGQVAKVSEYDFAADTVAYSSIVGNGGTAWSAADVTNGYTTITMPFAMQFGQTSIGRGSTLYVSANGYVTTVDATMTGIVLAPLSTTSGFTNIGANTVYTKVESNKVTVEWRKLKIGNNTVSFQLVLTNTGSIKFNYGPMTLNTTAQVFAGMQSSDVDVYCVSTVANRWDTIVPTYTSLTATRTLSPTVHPYYNVDNNRGLVYTFTQPECAKPNSFGAVPGDFNVIFNWTGNGSRYQIKYNEGADFAPMSQGTLLDNLTGNTTTVTNLPQRTTYYAYIRAFCQTSGSWSAWRAVADDYFTTGCGYEALPMTQNFEADPVCWDFLASSGDANDAVWRDDYYNNLTLRAGSEANGYANDVYAVLPKFNTNVNLNNYEVDLTGYVESTSYGTLTLGYITNINNLSGFVALTTINDMTTTSGTHVIYLTDLAAIPSGARLALKWSLATSFYDCYIDQIVVKPQPTCFPISNLQVNVTSATSATFSFTDAHSTSTAYQLVYGAPNFDPDAATPVTVTNGGSITTLEGSTNYQAYVRAACGSEYTDWIGPVSFSTPCPSVTVTAANPFLEQFNASDVPNCWSMQDYSSSTWSFNGDAAFGSSSSCSSDCEAWLYTPVFSFGTGDMLLSFKHYQQDWGGDQNYLTVYYRTSPSDEWHQIVQYTNSIASWTNEELTLPNTAGATEYQLAFTSTNSYGYSVYLDDIKVRPAPNCVSPANLAISPSKVLTWSAGNATQWQVRYGIAGSGNYTIVGANASTATLPLTGAAGTQYEISVRSICGIGDTNEWVDPIYYTMPLSLPYSCNFENGATGFMTQSTADNAWVVGTAKSNGGSNGFYVSNDGSSNVYATGSNIAYAYVTLPFETAGDYMVKYDWTANGESTWDFLRVALVPDNVSLITSYSNSYSSTTPSGWIAVDGGSKLNLNTNWNTRAEVVSIATPGNYKLVFAWMNDGSGEYQPPAAIDNVSVRGLNCNAPSNIALNGDGAVAWTPGNTTQWQVRWALAGSSNYTYAYVSTPSYTHASWTPNTSYTMDVRSICGANDTLDWMNFDFTMPCLPMTITYDEPYFEGFESTTFPSECWQNFHVSGSGTYLWTRNTTTSYIHTGSGSAKINDMSNQTLTNLVCPPIAIAANEANGYGVSFWMYRNATGTSKPLEGVRVWASHTNSTEGATLLMHAPRYTGITPAVSSTGWYEFDATIPLTGTVYIIFEGVCEYGSSSYMDDITIYKVPTCPKPTNLAATIGTDGVSATLTWQENSASAAAKSEVRYAPHGLDIDAFGTSVIVTTTTANIANLEVVQQYDWKVRSICTVGSDTSDWSEVATFTVPCPNGGNATVGTGTTSSTYGPGLYGNYGNSYVQQIYTAEELTAAGLTAGEIAGLTFTWTNNSSYAKELTIYVGQTTQSSFGGTASSYWVPLSNQTLVYGPAAHPLNTSGTVEYMFTTPFIWDGVSNIVVTDFMNQPSGTSQSNSGFYSVSTYNNTAYRCMYARRDNTAYTASAVASLSANGRSYYRSNITFIRPCDRGECAAPSLAIATSSDELKATLTFTDNNNESSPVFYYKWGAEGFDPSGATEYSTTNPTVQLTGLQSYARYDVYAYIKCSGTPSNMVRHSFEQPFVPNCFTPTTVAASNVTDNSSTIGWTPHANTLEPANGWEVRYRVSGSTDPYTTLTAQGTATSVALSNLDGNTTYEVEVRAICSNIESSAWSTAYIFTTLCTPVTVTMTEPYIYGFEDATGSGSAHHINACWTKYSSSTTAYPYPSTSYVANNSDPLTPTNNYCLYMYGYNTNYSYAVLPTFTNPLTDLQISLKVLRTSTGVNYGRVQIGVMTDPNDVSTFQLIQQVQPEYVASPYPWTTFEIPLNGFTGTPGRLAILAPADGTTNATYAYVDDIEVSLLPPCVKPSNAHLTALTDHAATIDWTQNSTNATEGSWDVMFGPSPLDVNNATVTTLNDHVFTATGLDEQTSYDFYVRANCGADGMSDWSSVFMFTTKCTPITITKYTPYIYGFEDATGSGSTHQISACWNKGAVGTTTAYPYPYNSNLSYNTDPITPTNNYHLYMYGYNAIASYAVLPEFTNPVNTLQLSLKVMKTASNNYAGKVIIGVMTDPTNINTFTPIDTVQPTSTYNYTTYSNIYFDTYTGANGRIALLAPAPGTSTSGLAYVDDIEVSLIPTCKTPTNLTSSNVYARTADLSWTESSQSTPAAWQVRYAPLGADLDNEGVTVETTGTATLALGNLVPETGYQWKVRGICTAGANYTGDTADWSNVANFTTTATCVVPTVSTPIATANSVTLSWTENTMPTAATQWEVAVGENGFNQNIEGMHFTTNQNSNYVVSGLKHSTAYQVYVRSLCSDEDWSNWSPVANFNTACAPWQYADMPMVQTFSVAGLPNCWTKAGGTASVSAVNNRMNIYSANSMVILPEMGFALDTIEMSLEAANYSGTDDRIFQVGYLTDAADTTTFTAVETITTNSTTFNEYNVSFAGITDLTARHIAIRGQQNGSSWADFYIKNVQVKLREPIVYLPSDETERNCTVFYLADTVNNEGTYAGNVNMTQTIYPGEAGKVLHVTGKMDCEYGYDYLTIYEGVGTTGNVLYSGTGYDENIDVKSTSYDWVNNGAMTIVFTTDIDNSDQYLGFKLLAQCECPDSVTQRDWVVDTNAAFTWVNGRTYSNNVTVSNQPDKSWSEVYMEKNVGQCDSVYQTLELTVHPTYTLTARQELCQRESYEFYGETFNTTGNYTRSAQTIYGADSTTTLTLQVRPAPTAYIYVNNNATEGTLEAWCDNADLVMTARATIEGSAFVWEDNSTAAVRTVNPHESATYTVTAYDPTYGCPSLPVTLAVTTTPVPALSIVATENAICAGGSTTLTVTDANNTGCTYLWSNNQTGNSITVSPATTTEYTVTATTPNASACTATATATITVNQLPVVTITPSANEICRYDQLTLTATEVEGYNYTWTNVNNATGNTVTFVPSNTGRYNLTVTDANGCTDEFVSGTVTVRPAYNINDTLSVCEAMLPITWGTQTLNDVNGGDYEQTWTIAYGCDSTVHLYLDVTATGVTNAYRTYCEGTAFTFGQGQYQTSHVADLNVTSLSYVDTTSDVCPVQYNLYLTVNPNKATSFEANDCDSYTWNEVTYTEAGSYNQTLQTVNECDSVVTMNLTLRTSTTGTDVQTVCDQLVWIDGQTYTTNNNTAQYTIENAAGCDSLVTLNLTVNYANTGIDDIRWCDTRTYTWRNGRTYDMNETDGTVRYLLPGVTNQYGCDSTQILNLVFNLAADTLAWADTTVCDIFILDTVACDGSLVDCQINQSGSYQLKTSIGNGRYVVSRFNVTVNHSDYHTTIVRNQCLPYEWRDANNTLIAVINDIFTGADTNISLTFAQAANGCDRTEVLRLTGAKAQTYAYVEDETCLGNSYTFTFGDNSTTVLTPAAAGTETYSLPAEVANVNGCDSTIRLTLTTHPTAEETVEETFCENSFVMGTDSAYHYTYYNEDQTDSVDLTYASALNGMPYSSTTQANWSTEHGCTRTVTINWTVNPNTYSTFDTTVLYTYTWDLNGETYDREGIYTAEAAWGDNAFGCDSIIALNLTLHDTVYYEFDTVFCTSYKGPDGNVYREDMTFVTTVEGGSQWGTDSVVTTNYIINGGELTDVYVASTDPYTWVNGIEYTANGEAYYNMTTVNGCDSTLMLHFTRLDTIVLCSEVLPYETAYGFDITTALSNTYQNNDVRGNDTIVSYIINLPTHNILVDDGCDSYTWDATGLTYTVSGDYVYNYTDNNGCASADTLKLTVYNNTSSSETVTACDTYTWVNNGNTVTKTESGTYYSNYLTADNCPSVDTLYLTVNYNTNSASTAIACDTYEWNNTDYTATGDYTYEYNATNGCPSVDTLHLTIGHDKANNTAITACDSYTWTENGTTYTASTVDSVVYQTIAGCDSTITLTLTVNYNSNSSEVDTACDTYTWVNNGNTITKTESGTYFSSYTNGNNCPSVDTLYLTVNHNTNSSVVDTACDTYTWTNHGNTVTETTSGTYYSNYLTAENCPSVDTLYLTVNASETYDTLIVSSEGTYTFTMVANDVTYDTMFSANVPTSFGPLTATFSNVNGCDSVVTYNFLVGTTRNKTEIVVACQEYTWARNNETYVFIDEAERAANNNALYKTINGTYIYEAPIVTVSNNNAVDSTFILNLVLTQRYFGTADTTFLLSNVTLTLGESVFDFSEQKAAGFNGTVQRTVYHPAVQYCDSAITYNINLVYNYSTANATICAEQNSYQWGTHLYATLTADTTYTFDTIGTDGWYRTLVVYKAAAITGDTTATACDTFDWYEHTGLTASSNTLTHVFTAANGCDSTVTLNLTINNSNTGDTAATACDTYDWYEHTGLTASSNTLTHVFTNAAGCDSTVTLNLTINSSNTGDTTATACDTFDWYEHIGLTASSDSLTHVFTNAAGCDSTVTLHLTINNNTSHDTTVVACDSYDWHGVRTASGVYYHNYNTLEGCASVDTLHLTINVSNSGTDEITACDSLQWINGVTYFINNYTAQHTVPNAAGCDSVVTLNLTINHATHNVTNITDACDNYVWTTSGQNYVYDANTTYPLTVTHNYVNNNNCPSVDTLFLTLHQSSAETFDITVCETFTWENNGNSITKTESGTYTSNYVNADGCASTDMLYLTINHTSTGSDTIATSNGYYSYNNVLYTADRNGADFFDTVFTLTGYTNVAGCDSTVYLTLLVGTTAIGMENQVVCDHFTWINGHTYEYRDNAPDGALYYDATADEWVYSRPRYTLPDTTSVDGFDTVSVLNLTLTQINYSEQNVTFLLSQQMCYLTDDSNAVYTVNFSGAEAGTFDTVFSFGATSHYCDSIITFHITLLDNYTQIAVEDICATAESYTWDNTNILGGHSSTYDLTTMITDFDHVSTITLTDTVFKGDANNEWVYAKVLTVHPVVYATERRTACDSYTWNGTTFYESTTTATRFFPNGSSYGCDSTVTLNLTIKYNTNTGYTVSGVCDSYTWNLNNETYTTSGDYYRPYTAANGCPSVDTLHLTVNYSTLNVDSLTVCDTYTWHGTQYTTSSDLEYLYTNPAGCPAVDSLYLTVNHNSNSGETTMACDSYEWHGQSYTASGEYFYNYNNPANECPSVDTLHLTINTNNGQTITESVCDTYTWAVDGQTYTTSGVYTYDSTDANGCYALCTLNLTVGYTTNNAETVVACNSYDWNNTTYTTSGTKLHSYTNTDGCPSTDTLYLTINTGTTYGVERITYCGPYTWIVNDSTIGTFTNDIETSTTFTNPRTMCDTVVFLQLVVNPAYVYQESATICETELPYTWRGIEMNAAGDTNYVFHIANNCDSTFNFTLTVNPLINVDLTDAVCFGNDYNANGFVIAAADLTVGTHVFSHTVPSVLTGCDSTTTLTLTVGDIIYNEPVEITACDSYSWNAGDGQTYNYTVSGTYNSTAYANAMGCTSVDVLELTINNNSSTGYTETACDSYSWNGTVYDVTGDYTFDYTDANGCASVDTLHLTVNHNSNAAQTETACDSYTWNGTTYTTSGTYTYNYNTAAGCASVDTLYLTVNYNSNAAQTETACDSYTWNGTTYTTSGDYLYSYNATNGCASVDTLHLTINNNSSHGETITACDAYTWHNTTYMVSGDYLYSYNTTDGCASVDTLHLTINNNSSTAYTVTACDSYNWNGQTYTSTGVYTNDYNTATGCASVDTLYLTINYNSNTAYTETACDSYEWNGTVYTTSGDYTYSYNTAAGCASVDTLHLTVNYNSNNGETVTACDSYTWNGTEYTTSGTYYYNYNTATGCASVDTLYLTVKYNNSHARTVIACDEYTWMGETYYTSGDYLYSYEAANGCPSVDTLHLTVNYNTNALANVVACDEYEWHGNTYTTGGTYTFDYIAANNCESTDTLVLTLNESKATSFTDAACNYYVWNGTAYTESGVYTQTLNADNGCDSVVTLNLTINTQVNTTINETSCGSYTWNGALYTTSGTYTQNYHSVAGCDSVVTLNLTVNPVSVTTISEMACGSYTWHGQTYTESGNYAYHTTAANGCDSTVNLILTVNNSSSSTDVISACESYTWRDGITYTASTNTPTAVFMNAAGCDSVITLHLTINHGTYNATSATVCTSYNWNGQTYTATGDYIRNYTNNLGCASVDTLHLTVMGNTYVTVDTTVCESMYWHGTTYTSSNNTATYTKPGFGNICDTVFTLNLTVNHGTHNTQMASSCGNYEWHGTTYTESGDYTYTYTNNTGCESVDTLHLTINGATNTVETIVACDSYEWHGVTYTESNNTATYSTFDQNGCENIVTLNLTINHGTNTASSMTACDSYEWHDIVYTTSGLYVYAFTSDEGCSSTDTLHLTINNGTSTIDTVMACNSYEWQGQTYTTSQYLTASYTDIHGCDSTVGVALTVNYTTYGDDVVVACDEYTWIDGVTYTEDAQGVEYTINNVAGCDSVVTLYLTLNYHTEIEIDTTVMISDMPFIYNGEEYYVTGGDYRIVLPGQNSVGCDSVILLHLVVRTDGEDGIDDVDALSELKLYPNPTRGQVTLTADEVIKVEVLDLVGRTVATFVNTNTFDLSDLVEGVYTLRITLPEGVAVRKVVKK
ncbi:MAG: fibronectin type III domain-containing protein [Bacteroidales bacterium]|nr:fibronectin type III domain-containing protein [Bacteroidales bacterium]